jgi:erythromycin esterase-like protein
MADLDTSVQERTREAVQTAMAGSLRRHAEALPPPEQAEDFGAAFARFSDAHVVLLGEATHGTSEFYRARAAITRRLIEHHGHYFEAVLAEQFDAYVWFVETKAVTPLPAARPQGVPETFPFGL